MKDLFFSIIIAAAGVLLIFLSIQEFNKNAERRQHHVKLKAKVIALSYQKLMYCPVLSYTYEHQTYTYHSESCSKPASFQVGEEVNIYIHQQQPEIAKIDSFFELQIKPSLLVLLGLICLMASYKIIKSFVKL